jgi:hypothetical protein
MKKLLRSALFTLLLFTTLAACKHDSTESKASLTIVQNDNSGHPTILVSGATVEVSLDTSSTAKRDPSFPRYQTTDANGKTVFTFSNGIVVNIYAYKEVSPGVFIKNNTFIAINSGETQEKTVVIK